jgi:hypothetical protein
MDITDIIPKEAFEKMKWECNDHETCKDCVYFYSSCNGLLNATDPRVQNMPESEKFYIQTTWQFVHKSITSVMFRKRLIELGVQESELVDITDEKIKTWIEKNYSKNVSL